MHRPQSLTTPGSVFLSKGLFTTYTYRAPPFDRTSRHSSPSSDNNHDSSQTPTHPTFQISLPALLETLQIFGLTDPATQKPPWARDNPTSTAFSNNVLGMNNMCRIAYAAPGAPLAIVLTEASIRTTCNLTTYEPAFADEIPFDRHNLSFKTIMRGSWLFDAISELSSTAPEKLTLWARMKGRKPYFALSSSGTLGSARVEFNNDSSTPQAPTSTHANTDLPPPPNLLETFQLGDPSAPLKSSYKFSLIQRAARAMSVATKVSVRMDDQGVLSLQFMIEVEAGNVSFVDFRFVPLVEVDEDGEADETMLNDGVGEEGSADEEGDEDMDG
jgi:cell cycle checkpoint protein